MSEPVSNPLSLTIHHDRDSADPFGISCHSEMALAEPQFTREEVDEAGSVLIEDPGDYETVEEEYEGFEAWERAYAVINNWRSSHAFPLNTFQMTLRRKAYQVDAKRLVAQRIKRLSSIDQKLRRLDWLRLSEMQDIGGRRVVLRTVSRVNQLVDLYKESDLKHELDDQDDYIQSPKRSGYRGIHLIYRYYSDRKETYNGLKIEMQFRSILQHAWATAVETVGTFIRQALKSSQGEEAWLRFFALMGTATALQEDAPPVPHTPTDRGELVKEIREYARHLDVESRLQTYGSTLRTLEGKGVQNAHYFLLELDSAAHRVTVTGYRTMELEKASRDYSQAELKIRGQPNSDAVLVSVESLASLRRAYPNYFLDTRTFLNEVRRVLS